jgi:peroxiredoxin
VGRIAPHLPEPDVIPGRASMVGTVAPEFQLKDEEGNYVTLRRLVRQHPLLFYVYRGAW